MIKSVKNMTKTEIIINKSKFICIIYPCDNENKIKELLNTHTFQYPEASHHCYAYIIGQLEKVNDDGEPSGTAGLPIMNVIKKNNLKNILVVVTRYFGGIKLGAGGLVRAYSQSCATTVKEAIICKKYEVPLYKISFDYPFIGTIDYLFNKMNIPITNKQFETSVIYDCFIENKDIFLSIQNITSNQYTKQLIRKEFIEITETKND